MTRPWTLPDGREVDLDHFVNWRPCLWAGSVRRMLEFLGDLRGKRVLEIGGKDARISSLLALAGAAEVTMADVRIADEARAETEKWNVADRVRFVQTGGGLSELGADRFDVICTKGVLVVVERLAEFLDEVDSHLAEGGQVAFLENYRGGKLITWVRKNVFHRRDFTYLHNVTPAQIPLFRRRFDGVSVRRPLFFVYEIFGRKKAGDRPPAGGTGSMQAGRDAAAGSPGRGPLRER